MCWSTTAKENPFFSAQLGISFKRRLDTSPRIPLRTNIGGTLWSSSISVARVSEQLSSHPALAKRHSGGSNQATTMTVHRGDLLFDQGML
jgi:hypothetical protein